MDNKQAAKMFCDAIRTLTGKPENIDNLESYLIQHFDVWMQKWAYNPEGLASEIKQFREMEV